MKYVLSKTDHHENVIHSTVYLVTSEQARDALESANITYEGEINLSTIGFNKVETTHECVAGTLYIPRLLDVLESRYKIMFFANKDHIVIVDDSDFSHRLILRIHRRKNLQEVSKEKFLYNFITEFITRDLEHLISYEKKLMELEDLVEDGKLQEFQTEIIPIRRELLTLRSYYDELTDLGKELEENENNFFSFRELGYFGTITDRANRLMDKTAHLLEYAGQISDAYKAQIDAKQNGNMQFLSVMSAIFYPLTLITGWYGMNFQNMPELKDGYPGVIAFSILVITTIIIIFKKKNML